MKFGKTKTAALTLATLIAAGSFSGCAFVTSNLRQDLSQTVAEVNIQGLHGESEKFGEEFGSDVASSMKIETNNIYKRDLVAAYASYGSTYVNSYGYTQEDTYELIKNNLVNRAIYLQYAQAYLLTKSDERETYQAKYAQAVSSPKEGEEELAKLACFLDEDEIAQAEYNLKVSLNSTLDSQETQFIETEEDEHDHDTARTTPTGIDTVNEDYYDPAYQIYTGYNHVSECGTYEAQDGSTPTTRVKAYKALLSTLYYYGLISKQENTSDITKLSYYYTERVSQYETMLINKLQDIFEEQAKAKITNEWIKTEKFDKTYSTQKMLFDDDPTAVEDALDGASDTSFVLYAPKDYGYVINILLPFSAKQSQKLKDEPADSGDKKGNKFMTRAALLEQLTATDQRNTWFTGHEDYSFTAETSDNPFTNGDTDRKYLFFEDSFKKSTAEGDTPAQYDPIPNYFGRYTYNGTVYAEPDKDDADHTVYTFEPNKLTIDDFLSEMAAYLKAAGLNLTVDQSPAEDYFTRDLSSYYVNNDVKDKVDYSSFLYYEAHINELKDGFDANHIFKKGSNENIAFSVINELSFAYNTDTAGLNSYLGYVVTPNKTDYVSEFEYAAQKAVQGGAGTITVAPSDYGWHIMYCTLRYDGETSPFSIVDDELKEEEGYFSALYYNALTASNFSDYSSEIQTTTLNRYDNDDCVVTYLNRYKDLYES